MGSERIKSLKRSRDASTPLVLVLDWLDIRLIIQILNLLFKALRDPTRRRILEMLKERDLTVSQISEAFAMSTPSISYHLDLLKQAQLVSAHKNGQFVTYSLETTVLDDSLGWLLELIKKKKGKRK
jgi:ArsR family transcriptional regulator, repressor of sdpIR and other operons